MEKASFKRQFISADPTKCTGCSICEYACALEKEKSFNPLRSRIRVVRLHPLVNVTMVCRFCEDAPCVPACPRDALNQSAESSIILVEEEKCDACGWCIQACPYSVRFLNPKTRMADKCSWCYHRVRKGLLPACVNVCPTGARKFGDLNDEDSEVYKILRGPGVLTVLKKDMGNYPSLYYKGLRREVV